MAAGDLDNDGRMDVLLLAQKSALVYLHNRTQGGAFLTLQLEGRVSNRDAVGARVSVRGGGRRQVAQRCGGGSFQSSRDARLHFGLGGAERVEEVEVRWPSGRVGMYKNLDANTGYTLREGDPTPKPLPGFSLERARRLVP